MTINPQHDRLKYSLVLVALHSVLLVTAFAQTPKINSDEWTRIESDSKDFSIALPAADCLVDNEKGKVWIWYSNKDRAFSVSMEKNGSAKIRLKALIASGHDTRFRKADEPDYQTIELDDFIGRWYTKTSDKNGSEYYSFDFASSHGTYHVSVHAPKGDSEFAHRFLGTARLGDKPLIKSDIPDTHESKTISINTLQTSDAVLQALKQAAPHDLKFNKELVPDISTSDIDSVYSRGLLILLKPRAEFTDEARSRNIQGAVVLIVKFLANGSIGSIRVAKSVGGGLDRSAFNAARQIKFIPPEINGKPVDVTRRVEYDFSIY